MKHGYPAQAGLRRRRSGGVSRGHIAFVGGLMIVAAFELLLMAKGWGY